MWGQQRCPKQWQSPRPGKVGRAGETSPALGHVPGVPRGRGSSEGDPAKRGATGATADVTFLLDKGIMSREVKPSPGDRRALSIAFSKSGLLHSVRVLHMLPCPSLVSMPSSNFTQQVITLKEPKRPARGSHFTSEGLMSSLMKKALSNASHKLSIVVWVLCVMSLLGAAA